MEWKWVNERQSELQDRKKGLGMRELSDAGGNEGKGKSGKERGCAETATQEHAAREAGLVGAFCRSKALAKCRGRTAQ